MSVRLSGLRRPSLIAGLLVAMWRAWPRLGGWPPFVGLVLCLLVGVLAGVVAGPVRAAEGAPRLLTVVIDDSYPPYVFRDQAGRLQGLRKDMWDLWSERTGIPVRLVGQDWAKAQAQIQAGQADVIDTLFETPQRQRVYDFGPAYDSVDVLIYFHEGLGGMDGRPESLRGFTIGVKEGDACIEHLSGQGLEAFRKYPSYEAVVDASAVGEVRVFCLDRPPANYFLSRKQMERAFRASPPLFVGQFHWAVRKGDAATRQLVQEGFARISPREVDEVRHRWLGAPIEPVGMRPYLRYGVYALLSMVLLALLLGAWSISLRRRVQSRTRDLSASLALLTDAKLDAERTLSQLHATLEAIPDLLFELDMDGRYVDYRANRKELLVTTPEHFLGRTLHEVMPAPAADLVMQALHEAAEHGSSVGVQICLPLAHGETWFELSVARKRMSGGVRDHFIVLSRDITDRKHAEQALARHGDELEKIVQERSRQLVEARDVSERASRAKSEFLSRMSHELRTPMNAILGFAQLIDLDPGSTPRGKAHVQEILRAGKHLLHLINDVLDLEQVESGRLTLTPQAIDLDELAREAVSLMQPLTEQQGVRLSMVGMAGLTVMADATRVRQVVLNLLSNAIKYNRPGGTVRLEAAEKGALYVRISVHDTGIGIAERHMGQLFQPFNRLGAEAGPIEGTGIGLSLCHRLVELMQGQMGVRSVEGQGSTFWVDLPRAVASPQAVRAEVGQSAMGPTLEGASPSPRMTTLLYVEDNPANLELMTQIVARHHGVTMISAPDGRSGLLLARAHRPDLILLDIHLPDIDGYAVLGQLRSDPDLQATPVIAVTANAMPMDVQRIRDAGFDDHVAKPIRVTHIDTLIHERLGTTLD